MPTKNTPNYIEGLHWVHKDEITKNQLRKSLRISGTAYVGNKIVDCWETNGDMVGLPRHWAAEKGYEGRDLTNYPKSVDCELFTGTYRKGQKECVEAAFKKLVNNTNCLVEAPTGFGKTLVGVDIASRLGTPALILVHKDDLQQQWTESAKNFLNYEAGSVRGGDTSKWTYQRDIVVSTMQTLSQNLHKLPKDFASRFGLLIFDEAHHFPCESMQSIMRAIPARYRLGVSATWSRSDKLNKIWELHFGKIGPKVKRVNNSNQKLTVEYPIYKIPVSERNCYAKGRLNHSLFLSAIGDSQELANEIAIKAADFRQQGRQILIVSYRMNQLKLIKLALDARGLSSIMYTGKHKTTKDEAAKSPIILSTVSKVSEGTDIPSLDTLIVGTPMGTATQVVGRITRQYKDKKHPHVCYPIIKTPYSFALSKKIQKEIAKLGFKTIS